MSEPVSTLDDGWLLPRCWAVANIGLIALSWRLWFPAPNASYPSVSLLGPNLEFPVWLGWIASVGLLFGLMAIAVRRRRSGIFWWVVLAALLFGFCIDQHRLQPWAYQTAIYAVIFAMLPRRIGERFLIIVASSVYLFSALGKFDFQFFHTVGQDFLQTLAMPFGGIPEEWTLQTRVRCAWLFPVTESVIGLGLLFPVSRRACAIAVMTMHATLIGILGPWGLNHSLGVLGWNLVLLLQAYLLFFRSRSDSIETRHEPEAPTDRRITPAIWCCVLLIALVVIAPMTERRGYWDHWLSWSLYSPHTSRVELELHQTTIADLPQAVQRSLDADADGDGWYRVNLSAWSLETRGVPVYPQARYQLGLSIQLLNPLNERESREGVRGSVRSASDRWSGKRVNTQLFGLPELRAHGSDNYWLWMKR